MLEALSKKQKIIFFIISAIMIAVIIYYIYSSLYQEDFTFSYDNNNFIENDLVENTENVSVSNLENSDDTLIIVYVCGAVKESKVVTLKENSRICDAIDAVGGLTKDADLTNINLAYILEDGEKIYIPKKGEELPTDSITSSSQNSSYSNYSSGSLKSNKININKATQTELETIPGVGPSTALKIINYREENGKFSSVEDIKNVSRNWRRKIRTNERLYNCKINFYSKFTLIYEPYPSRFSVAFSIRLHLTKFDFSGKIKLELMCKIH